MARSSISVRLYGLIGLFALSMFGLSAFSLYQQYQTLLSQRVGQLEVLTEVANGVLDRYRILADQGAMSAADARKAAVADVGAMRYSGNGYFVIYDEAMTMLFHPDPKLSGRNQANLVDVTGFKFIQDGVGRAMRDGVVQGRYHWNRPGETEPAAKLAVYRPYKPWGMILSTGIYIDDLDALLLTQAKQVLLATACVLVLLGGAAFGISRSIVRPLNALRATMTMLAQGRTDLEVAEARRQDEIGAMGRAVAVFRDNAVEQQALQGRQRDEDAQKSVRSERLDGLIGAFERSVAGITGALGGAASELQWTARGMTATAAETAAQSATVATAANEAAANVGTVATAAEELGASVQEISRQVDGSASLARTAVIEAEQSATLIKDLSVAAARIGDVVTLISGIAAQTNLLALNATIVAARGGDAGRGFAVVASEVKELAGQTTSATEEISAQISRIQGSTGKAVASIDGITGRIQEMSALSTAIAAAVEEQGAATQEIVRNVAQAAQGTSAVTGTIAGVAVAAEQTGNAASAVLTSASALSGRSEHLSAEVTRFLAEVRAA